MTTKLTAFETYQLYQGLKLHFSSDKYDFFQYHGKVRGNEDSFSKNSQKSVYYKLSTLYPGERLKLLFAVNLFRNPKLWGMNFFSDECKDYLNRKEQYDSAPDYYFNQDLNKIFDNINNLHSALAVVDGDLPKIYLMYINNEIMPETFLILNSLLCLTDKWKLERFTPFWPIQSSKLKKYEPFVNYNYNDFTKSLVKKLKEQPKQPEKQEKTNDTIVSSSI